MCIEHQQSTPCVCKVQCWDVILPDNQVVNAANCNRQWYLLAKWQIVLTSIATNLGSAQSATRRKPHLWPKSSQWSTLVPKVSLGGEEKQQWRHVPHTTDVRTCRGPPAQALCYPWFVLSLSRKSKHPTWHPAQWSMLLGHLMCSRPCHLTIMMTVIATIIVTRQYTHKTTALLQLNRLQLSCPSK